MGCKVITHRHGILTFRIYFEGAEYWKSTGKPDTAEWRRKVERWAEEITDAIKDGTFSLDWFQEEAKQTPEQKTVGAYYSSGLKPRNRLSLERDKRETTAITLGSTFSRNLQTWRL
jgi:hypothetical protein